jgi:hypothetical protein
MPRLQASATERGWVTLVEERPEWMSRSHWAASDSQSFSADSPQISRSLHQIYGMILKNKFSTVPVLADPVHYEGIRVMKKTGPGLDLKLITSPSFSGVGSRFGSPIQFLQSGAVTSLSRIRIRLYRAKVRLTYEKISNAHVIKIKA